MGGNRTSRFPGSITRNEAAKAKVTPANATINIKDGLRHESLKEALAGVRVLKEGKIGDIIGNGFKLGMDSKGMEISEEHQRFDRSYGGRRLDYLGLQKVERRCQAFSGTYAYPRTGARIPVVVFPLRRAERVQGILPNERGLAGYSPPRPEQNSP